MSYMLIGYIEEKMFNQDFFQICNQFRVGSRKVEMKDDFLSVLPDKNITCFAFEFEFRDLSADFSRIENVSKYMKWIDALRMYGKLSYLGISKIWDVDPILGIQKINIDIVDINFWTSIKDNIFYRIDFCKWRKALRPERTEHE
jgi:hypothetical protein